MAQDGAYLTTAQGLRLRDTDHSLKAGPRGPVLLQDHHLREKITHFDHERIPERVVHARGAGAHGVFRRLRHRRRHHQGRRSSAEDVETPVFVRFSTVLGSRGSADTVRDTRGFATKFYTAEGVFDLVGNNIPVFFIQDAIKFPDVIHAAKPHPDREIPQAQSAHDTFWDFVSLHTEATHHTHVEHVRPRHPALLPDDGGLRRPHLPAGRTPRAATTLVKFHWKPKLGVHSLVWEEAQLLGGVDPDFHRRDLADAIEAGAYPQWELGIQVFPDTPDQTFEGIDLLDPTKIVPEELAPVQPIGPADPQRQPGQLLRRDRAGRLPRRPPGARHRRHRRPAAGRAGCSPTSTPSSPGSAGPNFAQIPINRPHAPVNDMLRDGMHQTRRARGRRAVPAELAGRRLPVHRGRGERRVRRGAAGGAGAGKVRDGARLVRRPLQPGAAVLAEHDAGRAEHIIDAYTFELGKCYEQAIKERQLRVLGQHRPRAVRAGRRQGSGLPAPGRRSPLGGRRAEPRAVPGRAAPGRPTAGSSASSPDGDGDLGDVLGAVREAVLDGGHGAADHRADRRRSSAGPCRCSAPSSPHGRSSSTRCWWRAPPHPATDAYGARDAKARRRRGRAGRPTGAAAARARLPARQAARRLGDGFAGLLQAGVPAQAPGRAPRRRRHVGHCGKRSNSWGRTASGTASPPPPP